MIAPDTITAVRERVDIVALIGENVRLKHQGRRWVGLCPFHKEKTPSFSVNQERGFFHCFGCKESGSAIDYLMKLEGLAFPEAVRALADRCGLQVEETGSKVEIAEAERERRGRAELYDLNAMVAGFFERQMAEGGHVLRQHALDELARRGLLPGTNTEVDEALQAFRVGYAPYAWDGVVGFLRQQGVSPITAERLGLVAARRGGGGYYDAFRHRLMFAVLDKSGRVVAFSGRALDEPDAQELTGHGLSPLTRPRPDEPSRPAPKYINSPESPIYIKGETVFGLHQARLAIRGQGSAVLVEGNFDVLSLHARGLANVVAPLGTAFTVAQAKLIKRYTPTMVVLFDGDAAGKKAAVGLRGSAREGGLAVKVATLPSGVDPDDYARSKGVDAVRAVVERARGMLEYLIDEAIGDQAKFEGAREDALGRIRLVAKYLAEENDPNLRLMAKSYADQVASKLSMAGGSPASLRALEQLIERAVSGAGERRAEPLRTGPAGRLVGESGCSPAKGDQVGLAILGGLLEYPQLLAEDEVEAALGEVEGAIALGVLAVRQHWEAGKLIHGGELLDLMPKAVHSFAVDRMASPKFSNIAEARAEVLGNAEKQRRRSLSSDRSAKIRELSQAEGHGDAEAEDELLRQLERVARHKRGMS